MANDDTTDPFMQELIEAILKPLEPMTLREVCSNRMPSVPESAIEYRIDHPELLVNDTALDRHIREHYIAIRDAEEEQLRERLRSAGIDPDDRSDGWEARAREVLLP